MRGLTLSHFPTRINTQSKLSKDFRMKLNGIEYFVFNRLSKNVKSENYGVILKGLRPVNLLKNLFSDSLARDVTLIFSQGNSVQ
jgi:hypothetical protein